MNLIETIYIYIYIYIYSASTKADEEMNEEKHTDEWRTKEIKTGRTRDCWTITAERESQLLIREIRFS